MENFIFDVPTKILFGKGMISALPVEIKRRAHRVLLVYGGASIKNSGLYETVLKLLKENDLQFTELSGVMPNPKIDKVREGIRLCRAFQVQAILAVGGGSIIDCAKAISAGAAYDGDAWELVVDWSKVGEVLPVYTVLTLAATGSEMNGNAVISNPVTKEKKALIDPSLKPVCSVLDPTYTFTVSLYQTAAGTADIMSHVIESYFNRMPDADVQNGISESLLRVCIKYAPRAIRNPEDYDARANLMWAASLAINGLTSCGAHIDWSCHSMEHQLSAYYDVTHGAGLAVLTPVWLRHVLSETTLDKFSAYAKNVWNIEADADRMSTANAAIEATREFFISLGLPVTLRELGISDDSMLDEMAQKSAGEDLSEAFVPLNKDSILSIYRACY